MPSNGANHINANHVSPLLSIERLSESMINRIAAGEVVERPASVVKELVENAIDAGATRIAIATAAGGKNLIRVTDNGHGMGVDDLVLAVERHCTSKISRDLLDIRTMGFRGEALPSIGSVARLEIRTRSREAESGWSIVVDNGKVGNAEPIALPNGTHIEVGSLFASVPARLKFLKSDRAENNAISEIVKRIALAFPKIHFTLSGEDRSALELPPADLPGRIGQVLGRDFIENSLEVDAGREGFHLSGFTSLPTYNRGNALNQFFYVNGRPVRDKALLGALRGAYRDFLPSGRHAACALFIRCDPSQVDVNVHPAKADVRFRDSALVRGLIVGSIKQLIAQTTGRSSTLGTKGMQQAFHATDAAAPWTYENSPQRPLDGSSQGNGFAETRQESFHVSHEAQGNEELGFVPSARNFQSDETNGANQSYVDYPLGAARAQVHENYIIAQTSEGMIMVDQHAAHERIIYEKLKNQMANGVAGQMLLIPEVVEISDEDASRLQSVAEELTAFGLVLEGFGDSAILVRQTPAMLGEVDIQTLVQDLADEMREWGSTDTLQSRVEYVAATIACHGSIRSGRIMRIEEMNALLRQMEATPNSDQCNHGRPTWIKLDLKDIERLFGR